MLTYVAHFLSSTVAHLPHFQLTFRDISSLCSRFAHTFLRFVLICGRKLLLRTNESPLNCPPHILRTLQLQHNPQQNMELTPAGFTCLDCIVATRWSVRRCGSDSRRCTSRCRPRATNTPPAFRCELQRKRERMLTQKQPFFGCWLSVYIG